MLRPLSVSGALLAISLMLASCGQEASGGNNQMSYKDVKSMVIDILGSEEAKKIINEASSESASGGGSLFAKSLSPQDQEQVKLAVKDVLTSPDYSSEMQKLMKDPKFAGEFAQAISKDNKQIHKDLMKDPEYQKEMIDMLKNPEAQLILFNATKTTEFRKQMMSSVNEAIQNPLFKLELMKMLQSIVKEELTPKASSDGKKKSGDGEGGGEGSGGKSGNKEDGYMEEGDESSEAGSGGN